jgi:hypothetical protein
VSNGRKAHPLGPGVEAALAQAQAQQQNADVMQQLPEMVRPQPYPKAIGIGIEEWNGERVFALQVFQNTGIMVMHFTPDEWDGLNAQVQARMVECRTGLQVAHGGIPLLGQPAAG